MFRSLYSEYIKGGGTFDLIKFLNSRKGKSLLSRLRYFRYIKELEKMNKVLVIDSKVIFNNPMCVKRSLENLLNKELVFDSTINQ